MNNSFIKRIKRYTENMLDNVSWGSKGRKSRVIKPMRVLGKSRIFLGERVMILNQARLETVREWGDKELNGQLLIGNGTSFEQCCHVVAADRVEIGDGCVFSAFVYISDCAHGYSANTGIMDANLVVKPVKIGNHCFVGIGSCVMPGVTMGNNVVVGANTVVTSDVPDNCMVAGSPARIIKKYNPQNDSWEKYSEKDNK